MEIQERMLKEMNTLADKLVMSSSSFDVYQEHMQEYAGVLGLMSPTPRQLRQHYENNSEKYARNEKHIIEAASRLVHFNDQIEISPQQKAELGLNDIGENIAKGPHLTILDGGPGAGKSFSLGKAMDAMAAPVICLGATKSAAAGLFKDMDDIRQEHVKKGENSVSIVGGLTVDQFLNPNTPAEKALKAKIDHLLQGNPKPVFMVDEAGLLGHKEMDKILNYAAVQESKIILAGDSQQIPPEKGQPFKILTESLKDTPAYVNAPYVFRQGDFIDKAITSGIYHGFASDGMTIAETEAVEFMTAAYDVGDPKFADRKIVKDNGQEKDFTFKNYMQEKYPSADKAQAVRLYVSELNSQKEAFFAGSKEAMLEALQKGPSNEVDDKGHSQYDKYVCAALMCQSMGVQAYELRGKMKIEENIEQSIAQDFAENYMKSLIDGQTKRQNKENKKAQAENKPAKTVGLEYADGKLAITATKEEAKKLNDAIRKAMGKEGQLTQGEPIILADGSRVLASAEQARNPPEGFNFAYALDVTTTQGMSQNGKVTMVVVKATENNLQGGEILVGATRHKGDFEIKMSSDANKESFYENSTHQFAAARIMKPAFRKSIFLSAGGQRGYVEEKETHSSESRKQVVEQKQQVNLKTVQSKKINLQSILEEKVKGNEKKIDIIKIKTEKTK